MNTGGRHPDTWTETPVLVQNVFPYNNGPKQDQITAFGHIPIDGLNVSSRILFKIYRDGQNVGDEYKTYLYITDFDCHVPVYTLASKDEITR